MLGPPPADVIWQTDTGRQVRWRFSVVSRSLFDWACNFALVLLGAPSPVAAENLSSAAIEFPPVGAYYADIADSLDPTYIWFKDDPRWQPLYEAVLDELQRKQHPKPAG